MGVDSSFSTMFLRWLIACAVCCFMSDVTDVLVAIDIDVDIMLVLWD